MGFIEGLELNTDGGGIASGWGQGHILGRSGALLRLGWWALAPLGLQLGCSWFLFGLLFPEGAREQVWWGVGRWGDVEGLISKRGLRIFFFQ